MPIRPLARLVALWPARSHLMSAPPVTVRLVSARLMMVRSVAVRSVMARLMMVLLVLV